MFSSTAAIAFGLLTTLATLAVQPAAAQTAGTTFTVQSAADGEDIAATYYPPKSDAGASVGDPNAPVVILIHGENDNRLVWEKKNTNLGAPAAELLSGAGFAVVAVDMRGYGESEAAGGRRVNPQAMIGDLEAIKQFLMDKHQAKELNINKLGIVAAGELAPIAANFAEYDWKKPDYDDALSPAERTPRGRDVQAVVLLSPAAAVGRMRTNTALRFLTDERVGVGVLIINGKDDPRDRGTAADLGKLIRSEEDPQDNRYLREYPTAFHATDLIGQRDLPTEREMFGFLSKYLKDLDKPWADRRSKLER